jgi:hypothetical protein
MVPAGGRHPPTGIQGLFAAGMAPGGLLARSVVFNVPLRRCALQVGPYPMRDALPSGDAQRQSWYPRRDSNPQITGFEPAALPICYSGLAAPREGFEPSSVALTGRRTAVVRPRTEMKIWATGVAGWTLSRAVGSVPVAARSTFACRLAMAGPEGRRNCAAHRLRICRASPAASLHVERPNARIASPCNRVAGFFEPTTRLGRHHWRVEQSLCSLNCVRRLQVRWDRDAGGGSRSSCWPVRWSASTASSQPKAATRRRIVAVPGGR